MTGRLLRELKQTKPFASLEVEAFLNLVRTADHLARDVASMLKAYELHSAQYNVLRILRGAGPEGLPCGEIGARMVTYDPDITRLIDRLERRGLVTRSRGQEDRRVVLVRITPSGTALLAKADLDTKLNAAHKRALGHLGKDELTSLIDTLESIRDRLEGQKP
jgi:DNA-binding MarR family transcriptional regulator